MRKDLFRQILLFAQNDILFVLDNWYRTMAKIVADLHMHSRYSEAVSPQMTAASIAAYAARKGVTLAGTGDFTHPKYLIELKESLRSSGKGLFKLKSPDAPPVSFMLTTEVTNIFFSRLRKEKRTHVILLAPSFAVVDKLNTELARWGHLDYDGRPTFRRHVKDLVKLVLDISSDCMIIPAHLWTPWYSVFGSAYGFNSLEECFEEETRNIHAVETGLDSDPAMNWRVSDLDDVTLISCSDAHSLSRIGREATVFDCAEDYHEITGAIQSGDASKLTETIELFPESGKYYLDGHRKCGISFFMEEARKQNYLCPECKLPVTVGVIHRVEALASRPHGFKHKDRPSFRHSVPLEELIADAFGLQPKAKKVQDEWEKLTAQAETELAILHELPEHSLRAVMKKEIAERILKMRAGEVTIDPGFDGEYGKVRVPLETSPPPPSQLELF